MHVSDELVHLICRLKSLNPLTDRGNKYILVLGDYFTKWVESFPIPNMEAKTIANMFVGHFVSRFGAPDVLHTDQGRNFESALFKEVCLLLGVHKTRTTPYHPQSDGLVERRAAVGQPACQAGLTGQSLGLTCQAGPLACQAGPRPLHVMPTPCIIYSTASCI